MSNHHHPPLTANRPPSPGHGRSADARLRGFVVQRPRRFDYPSAILRSSAPYSLQHPANSLPLQRPLFRTPVFDSAKSDAPPSFRSEFTDRRQFRIGWNPQKRRFYTNRLAPPKTRSAPPRNHPPAASSPNCPTAEQSKSLAHERLIKSPILSKYTDKRYFSSPPGGRRPAEDPTSQGEGLAAVPGPASAANGRTPFLTFPRSHFLTRPRTVHLGHALSTVWPFAYCLLPIASL